MGPSRAKTVQIPSLSQPYGTTSYAGTILRPSNLTTYPGARPVVVLQHGNNGNQCRLWWAAQMLAGHGYIALAWTVPSGSDVQNFIRSSDATRSALAFVRSAANPFAAIADESRIALAGSSLGAIVVSHVQSDGDPSVRTAVALDNLQPGIPLDAAGDGGGCGHPGTFGVAPRVPALGFAKDFGCETDPSVNTPDLKQRGYAEWRRAGVPAMQLVMRGYKHTDFMANGSEAQRLDLTHYLLAWLALWLDGDPTAEDRLLATTVRGRPTSEVLSSTFRSAAYLPPRIDTTDLVAWLSLSPSAPDADPPATKRRHGPPHKVPRRQMRGHGLVFHFASTEAGGRFQCRLSGKNTRWHRCNSPEKVRRVAVGRHRFFVRAIDAAGNVDPTPAFWGYRVVR